MNDNNDVNSKKIENSELHHNHIPNVLVVDDRCENLIAMSKVLKKLDVSVFKANSGNEGIKYAMEYDFAVILLDVQMPEMNGFETATILRENERSKNVPIIFVTAINKEQKHVFEGYEAGAVDYLFKPIDARILRSKVSVFIDMYKENYNKLKELIIELELSKEKLEKSNLELLSLARKDALTFLPNRLLFEEAAIRTIANCQRNSRRFALLILDIDNFKTINDTLGHDVGDLVLKAVAERLTITLRAEDFIARLGGDEFAIILTDVKDYHQAGNVANKIIESIQRILRINEKIIHAGASIGIACYPDAGESIETLIKHADIALYQAKDQGKNCASYFTEDLNKKYLRRSKIEKNLHDAILNNEFHLVFQPIFNIKTRKIVGMEALLRWKHPELGVVSPEEFIPISEEIGLASTIGSWVLKNACHDFSKWQNLYECNLRYAVNLSVCQLIQGGLLDTIAELHGKCNIPAKQLVLEITETTLMHKEHKSMALLHDLDGLGFQISIDDFGTGYSSLSRLQKMPINILKIDRSFISNLDFNDGTIIAKAIIDLAKNLKLGVVAEGVETKSQEKFLLENDCETAQGFLYSKPLIASDMNVLLKKQFVKKGKI